jgi:uncharacterized membrane protein YkvA (DUF1232 family)
MNQIQHNNNSSHNGRRGLDPRMIVAILAGLYGLSPIDAMPDFIPVLGQMDDAGVILLAVVAMLVMSAAGMNGKQNNQ